MELTHLADPEIGVMLTGRGYRLVAFENVLGKLLDGSETPRGCRRGRNPAGRRRRARRLARGGGHRGSPTRTTKESATHEDFPARSSSGPNAISSPQARATYLALRDGVVAGGGGLRITDGVAQLVGAATAPEHRRRGVQTALLATRLADAADAGCDIAVVTTAPGSKSQQNVQRQGFHLLYTRAVLVK